MIDNQKRTFHYYSLRGNYKKGDVIHFRDKEKNRLYMLEVFCYIGDHVTKINNVTFLYRTYVVESGDIDGKK